MIGPGTHLKRKVEWFGFKTCNGCEEHAEEMDRRGPAWCRENISLIAWWLQTEAFARGIPMVKAAFYPIILTAIERAERDAKILSTF